MEGEARYMRRKVKAGLIEADHAQCAIVVHYEVEATVLATWASRSWRSGRRTRR